MFPFELGRHPGLTRVARRVSLVGGGLGLLAGALGVGTALSMLAAVPVLLLPLPVLGVAGWTYARRRQHAAALAAGFAAVVSLVQSPFAVWYVRRLPPGATPDAALPAILMLFVGLALAPVAIAVVRRHSADVCLTSVAADAATRVS